MKFKKDDRVQYRYYGSEGIVLCDNYDPPTVPVQFDKPIYPRHSCHGLGKNGYCWYCHEKDLELVNTTEFSTFNVRRDLYVLESLVSKNIKIEFGIDEESFSYEAALKDFFKLHARGDTVLLSVSDIDYMIDALYELKHSIGRIKGDKQF